MSFTLIAGLFLAAVIVTLAAWIWHVNAKLSVQGRMLCLVLDAVQLQEKYNAKVQEQLEHINDVIGGAH